MIVVPNTLQYSSPTIIHQYCRTRSRHCIIRLQCPSLITAPQHRSDNPSKVSTPDHRQRSHHGSITGDASEVEGEDDDEDVEEDEEEIDVDVCLAACVEERPAVGVRRSARLQAESSERASRHMAQLLQEQTEQQACYEDD